MVKLVSANLLDDERTCQVDFEWVPGLQALPESSLKIALQIDVDTTIPSSEWGGIEDLQRRLGSALAMSENSRTGSFMRSFVKPLPHQAFLLDKIISHNRFGHVIADDVGMGKTIEAGLIVAALKQRDPRLRVLILSPAGVVLQWQEEMEEHFGLDFRIVGHDIKGSSLPNWKDYNLFLASLDTLKQERYQEILKQIPPFDLVICDEAHRLTARREFLSNELYRTLNYRFVEWLSAERVVEWTSRTDGSPRSPRLLLLTATPHQGDDLRFAYLLQLARPDQVIAESAVLELGGLCDANVLAECITRTAKHRAVDWDGNSIFQGHETRTLDVELTPEEKEVLRELSRYVLEEMQFSGGGNPLIRALAMHTFQKIAASSWPALEAALRNRITGKFSVVGETNEEDSMGAEFWSELGDAEKNTLESLIRTINELPENSKWNNFEQVITPGNGFRESGERLLIFTQYRRTQEWLAEQLAARGEKVALIHGGLNLLERKRQRIFFESEGTILLSTEAGGEGANLHRKCHLEINYDLPWNPMRLLQRIGRLDRYGQKHKVRVVNLRAPHSWDSAISIRIAAKLESVQAAMGQVADEDYRAMILGEIHEAVNIPEIMSRSDWGRNQKAIDERIDVSVRTILSRKSVLDQLFQESMGMPSEFDKSAPALQSEDFRQAFAWVASGQGVELRGSRTSDNRVLKGVYHFTLPVAFRAGFRPNREVYLVFDRDVYADVRGEELGTARGQPINPSLAGFGDSVTDWFFRRGLQAGNGRSVFSLDRVHHIPKKETWWISFGARWKRSKEWAGPDGVFTFAVERDGSVVRLIPTEEVFQTLAVSKESSETSVPLPDFTQVSRMARSELRKVVPEDTDPGQLALFFLVAVSWGE